MIALKGKVADLAIKYGQTVTPMEKHYDRLYPHRWAGASSKPQAQMVARDDKFKYSEYGDSTFDYRMASSGETTEIRSKPSRQVRQVLRGDELPYDTKDTHHDANFEAPQLQLALGPIPMDAHKCNATHLHDRPPLTCSPLDILANEGQTGSKGAAISDLKDDETMQKKVASETPTVNGEVAEGFENTGALVVILDETGGHQTILINCRLVSEERVVYGDENQDDKEETDLNDDAEKASPNQNDFPMTFEVEDNNDDTLSLVDYRYGNRQFSDVLQHVLGGVNDCHVSQQGSYIRPDGFHQRSV
eukprot:CAMPEP_0194037338 /NCGR_PEP_ID=MMETSP0009_2-20130614/9670_1 /TAXON_ID=210454 /ORGANISM="Grammatophora oceanica, Strain CCMP 410" /LENGTH=303 /DNA_ID=CAMNT_0038679447 /DNA_START=1193 /DNA_END=2105 /DNA_ORIENTATION=-